MPSPFPGMNPYLENPELWTEVHHRLITAIANTIEATLSLDYRVAIERRVYSSVPEDAVLIGISDATVVSQAGSYPSKVVPSPTTSRADASVTVVLPIPQEVREGYLEIRDIATGRLITVLEVLSPSNKRPGKGRDAYERKRNAVLESATHLVEIDLLRDGMAMAMVSQMADSDYRILVSRSPQRPQAQLYGFSLRQPIPVFLLPLQSGEAEIAVDLQTILVQVYNQARYDLAIDYQQEPTPTLKDSDRLWADTLLKSIGLR